MVEIRNAGGLSIVSPPLASSLASRLVLLQRNSAGGESSLKLVYASVQRPNLLGMIDKEEAGIAGFFAVYTWAMVKTRCIELRPLVHFLCARTSRRAPPTHPRET